MKPYRYSYGGALIDDREKKAIMRAVNKGYWPAGKEANLMEKEAAKYLNVKYGVLANSGSSAGLLALSALELPKGSEVIIPAVTFPTIFNIILQCGLVPVVVDSKIGTYNLDPKELEAAISDKTRAIICVHAVGNPVDMPAVIKIAKNLSKHYGHKIYTIEDNCDGWGGNIGSKRIGSFGYVTFTSFHAAHIVAMGQGGGVFTNDKELARKVRMYRDWGRQSNIPRRINGKKWPTLPEDYDSRFIYEKIGYNLGPLELQAAMGRVQLKKTEKIKALRKRNFHYLYAKLSQFPDLILPTWVKGADPSWFAMPLSTCSERGPLVAFLEKKGIETRSMFAGDITKHPAYENTNHRSLLREDSECGFILRNSFWIGVHPRYAKKDLDWVVSVFAEYYDKAK